MQPTVTLTMYIPTSSVGAVIGRRGANIANLQKLASGSASTNQPVRVSVIGQDSTETLPYTYSELDFSDPNWTPVVIRADPRAAFTAAIKLEDTVGAVDEVVLDIPVSRNKHAAIVGKRGLTLANMSADTNVRIMVPNKLRLHDCVQLEGDLDNVKRCLDRVLQVAAKAKPPKSEEVSSVLLVQQLPSQTKLRSVGRKTETSIKKKKMDESSWQLTVSGATNDQVQNAIAMLKKWNESDEPAAPSTPGPRRPNNRGKRNAGRGEKGTPKRGGKTPTNSKPTSGPSTA